MGICRYPGLDHLPDNVTYDTDLGPSTVTYGLKAPVENVVV